MANHSEGKKTVGICPESLCEVDMIEWNKKIALKIVNISINLQEDSIILSSHITSEGINLIVSC